MKKRNSFWRPQNQYNDRDHVMTLDRANSLNFDLEKNITGYTKELMNESYRATMRMLEFFGSNEEETIPSEVVKTITVIETSPFHTPYGKQYQLMTEGERQWLKLQNPDLVVRLATQEELQELKAEQKWED